MTKATEQNKSRKPATVELTGTLTRIRVPRDQRDFRAGGFMVLEITDENGKTHLAAGATGALPQLESRVTLSGEWKRHPQYGEQFKFTAMQFAPPSTKAGALRWLQNLKHVGPVKAQEILDRLGDGAPTQLLENPDLIKEFISDKRSHEALNLMAEQRDFLEVDRQLCDFGFGDGQRRNIIDFFKPQVLRQVLSRDPYQLVRVPRISFRMVDDGLMEQARFPPESPFRAAAAIIQVLNDAADNDGHTWLTRPQIDEALNKLRLKVGIPTDGRAEGVGYAIEKHMAVRVNGDDGLALFDMDAMEAYCAKRLMEIAKAPPLPEGSLSELPADIAASLTDEQAAGARSPINHGITVITGGPGTGKTFLEKAILRLCERVKKIILAPTGKAAKRASDVTGHEALTIHRFALQAEEMEESELPTLVIIDEVSMQSIEVLFMLLRVLTRHDHHIVFIGDVDQLPAVGAGQVLHDLILSGAVPVTRLTKIHRQALDSAIITNAHRINRGEGVALSDSPNQDWLCRLQPQDMPDGDYAKSIVDWAHAGVNHWGLDPINDLMVLCPMKRGALGVNNLNYLLRERFNPVFDPEEPQIKTRDGDSLFRRGDKVLCTSNNPRLGVVNGDVGVVTHVRPWARSPEPGKDPLPDMVKVAFDDGRRVEFAGEHLYMLTQAWCMTIHKSQGSESRVVFLVVHKSHHIMLYRSLLYTAVTRASERVVICGTGGAVMQAIKNDKPQTRQSRLASMIQAQTQ